MQRGPAKRCSTLRVLAFAPYLGEQLAVLLELSLMPAISWFACSWTVNRFNVLAAASAQLIMGSVAFILLMAADLGLSFFALRRTVTQHFQTFLNAASLLGIVAQFAFALFPVIQLWVRHNPNQVRS
jgi:hypothetical protein